MIIDITQELFSSTVFPGDTAPTFTRVRSMPGDDYNLTDMMLSVHNGTHADAPKHFIADGAAIDELELSTFVGRCVVMERTALESGDAQLGAERVLLKGDAPLDAELARALVSSGTKLVGVEPQSVGPASAPAEVHRILLGAGVVVLEGLRLGSVEPGEYTLCALPLKLAGSDGSPVRAILMQNAEC